MSSSEHDAFMAEALALAERGRRAVEPNPMVGAVVVRDGRVIGRGWHKNFGGPHAEIEAIADARAAGADLAGATIYVTLEPCCHLNKKTPPCTDALIAAKISRVVVAMADPDPNVRGAGIAALRAAKIEIVEGVLESRARQLLAAYIKLRTTGRPWVICKWAQSLDGRIATFTGHSKWISGEQSRARAHELRSRCDGICVGVRTVQVDNPLLTNRSGAGRQPARVILDANLQTPPASRLFSTLDVSPVILAAGPGAEASAEKAMRHRGAEILRLPKGPGGVDLSALLTEMGKRQWTNVLVEGGRSVLGAFLGQDLADELLVFVAPVLLGGTHGLGPVDWPDVERIDQGLRLPPPSVEPVGEDVLLTYRLH